MRLKITITQTHLDEADKARVEAFIRAFDEGKRNITPGVDRSKPTAIIGLRDKNERHKQMNRTAWQNLLSNPLLLEDVSWLLAVQGRTLKAAYTLASK